MNGGVEIRNLKKNFVLTRWHGFRRTVSEICAVDDISISIHGGESVAFIGPNGAGKSTTIKMLAGILHPTRGEVSVLGLTPWRERRKLAYHIGAVFGQRSQLWYHLPPVDTFELLARIYSIPRLDYARTRNLLIDRFALEPFLHVPVRKLSLGQRMRAEVAASLLHRPRVLFLDEPTIGLDVIARQELRDLIREWNRRERVTVFLTSHDAGDIEHVADRVVVINHGRVVLDDQVAVVRRQYLGSKVLRVQFQEQPAMFNVPGVEIIRESGYEVKLELDVTVTSVAQAIQTILLAAPVTDISVEDPPLEQVIARIYAKTSSERGAPS